MKHLFLLTVACLFTASCSHLQGTRQTASDGNYPSKLCFSNTKDFSGDESYCTYIKKAEMQADAITVTDQADKSCKIGSRIMPVSDLGEIKKSLDAGTPNYLICVTSSQHIHTDKNATNVLYHAQDFDWYAQ